MSESDEDIFCLVCGIDKASLVHDHTHELYLRVGQTPRGSSGPHVHLESPGESLSQWKEALDMANAATRRVAGERDTERERAINAEYKLGEVQARVVKAEAALNRVTELVDDIDGDEWIPGAIVKRDFRRAIEGGT